MLYNCANPKPPEPTGDNKDNFRYGHQKHGKEDPTLENETGGCIADYYDDYSDEFFGNISLDLDNNTIVSIDNDFGNPLVCVYKDSVLIDTFRVESNGIIDGLFKARQKDTFYMISDGGSAHCGIIGKINIKTRKNIYLKYEAMGFVYCERQGDRFVVHCKTKHQHSFEGISYEWTDTLDQNFRWTSVSDTTKVPRKD